MSTTSTTPPHPHDGTPGADGLLAALHAMQPDLVALRRTLHQCPEVGLDLPRTQALVLEALAGLPLEVHTGEASTSVTAVLRGRGPVPDGCRRPVVLLRGDMDGLPVREETGLDYASTTGTMHACGHDLHVAMLVGAARALSARADDLLADVVFMFQPGEEGHSGATHMIAEGVLDAAGRRADAAHALHVFSGGLPTGMFATRAGTVMASSDNLNVTVRGRGGHGSTPQKALDPVPALCEMVLGTQVLLGRHFDVFDPAVITVGKVQAGTARNVIPAEGRFEATLRCFSTTAQDRLFDMLPPMLQGIAASHGVQVDVELNRMYPPTVNDPDRTQHAADAITSLFGADRLLMWPNPMTPAEDFSFVLQQVPGAFIGVSAVPPDTDPDTAAFNHSPLAVYDDAVLADGAALLARLALDHPALHD